MKCNPVKYPNMNIAKTFLSHKQMLITTNFLIFCSLPLTFQSCKDGAESAHSDYYTQGIGIYPGAPSENFAPNMVKDNEYRNIALHRAAYSSNSYDYNLTAQLITDGYIDNHAPNYLEVTTSGGTVPRREREWAIDGGPFSRNILRGDDTYIQYHWTGEVIHGKRLSISGDVAYNEVAAKNGYEITALASKDGKNWDTIGQLKGKLPGEAIKYKVSSDPNKNNYEDNDHSLSARTFNIDMDLNTDEPFAYFRLNFKMDGAKYWMDKENKFFDKDGEAITVMPAQVFSSAWMNAEGDEQWVCIDLGTKAKFDRIKLFWLCKPNNGTIQTSDDAKTWKDIATLPNDSTLNQDIKVKGKARYIRLALQESRQAGEYILSEMEIWGKGGLVAQPAPVKGLEDGKYFLSGGDWKLCRSTDVKATGEEISTDKYDTGKWITATVPGTVLSSFINIGAIPNPNYADNVSLISESYFNEDFWYRNTFEIPTEYKGKDISLNFDGINWKANIYLNGVKLDDISGAFIRGKYIINNLLKEGKNTLAVQIIHNAHYGAVKEKYTMNTDFNGGILGADNPTFHASIGWDWITTVRGRNMGIWNNVYLEASGKVTIQDPLVTTKLALPDTLAAITPSVFVVNHSADTLQGKLSGYIGNIKFEKPIEMLPNSHEEVRFLPDEFTQLKDQRMNLWWPNGYGTPYLYDAGFTITVGDAVSDEIHYKAGIRQMSYKDENTQLKLYVNGRRFIPLGGNWGFSEHNLNYRAREYDIAVRYHKEMNFNMIRNWVGMIGDEPFYEACDKYGIMIWQDFWLANPVDGPNPYDETMFMTNANDYVKRIRNHASIGLYCGRNEGYPTPTLDKAFREYVDAWNPGIVYISSSADDGVSGHGPYRALAPKDYFSIVPVKFHSERGMPNVMTIESLTRTLSPDALWPQNDQWGKHDYTMEGAQRGQTFNALVENGFGKSNSAKQFTELAQWVNYNGYRAMYESSNVNRLGLVIWMSHSCWPSMTWCTYDYYFEPTGAYFGSKKACEPLHIQWNEQTDSVEVVNLAAGNQTNLKAEMTIRNINGEEVSSISVDPFDIKEDATIPVFAVGSWEYLTQDENLKNAELLFVDLKLYNSHHEVISDNFYLKGKEYGNYQALNKLAKVKLNTAFTPNKDDNQWNGTVTIENTTKVPAMMIRLNLQGADGEQILPVIYSDNYFSIMPREKKEVAIRWKDEDTRGQQPKLVVTGFNVE